MLNHRVDQNFTDFLFDFLIKNIKGLKNIKDMKYKPTIIGGKDRDYSILNEINSLIEFLYFDEKIEISTSKNFIQKNKKKCKLFLRVNNEKEFLIFFKYMKFFYESIEPIYIKDEINFLKNQYKNKKNIITICKDYKDLFDYKKVSRIYDHPLSKPYHKINNIDFKNKIVIDSDIFSGLTRDYITKFASDFIALKDLSNQEYVELIDIDDMKNEFFNYPYVDLSSKCSLPPFTPKMHDIIKNLKMELNKI